MQESLIHALDALVPNDISSAGGVMFLVIFSAGCFGLIVLAILIGTRK